MTIDERLEALTMNLEVGFRDIQELKELARKDGENIFPPSYAARKRANGGWRVSRAEISRL
jgi:hypothetical protein